mgnify:CR=1 FL=1
MSETMSDTDWFGDPAAADDVAQEFEPDEPADPEEPETLADDAVPADPGEADYADVIDQREPAGVDEDGYERED